MFKIGVIGLGNHFLEHILGAIKLRDDMEVSVICDIDEQKIKLAKDHMPNAKTTTNWEEVFNYDVDIVMCISFPQLHEAVIERGIRKNIAVFVEKPPYLSSKKIKQVTKLIDKVSYKKPIAVGINFNYSAMAEVVQKIVETGGHGPVVEVDICHLSNKPDYDVWGINYPLQTMLLSQAIHPLALLTLFMDEFDIKNTAYSLTSKGECSLIKLIIPGTKNAQSVSGGIRTGNYGPRFSFHMSLTLEDGSRIECTPERVKVYDFAQPRIADTNKWVTVWEAKAFMPGVEKGGYFQEIDDFVQAIKHGRTGGVFSPLYYEKIYQVMEKVLQNEKAREQVHK